MTQKEIEKMTNRFERLNEIYKLSKNRDEITDAINLLDKIKEENARTGSFLLQHPKGRQTGFFMDGVGNFALCIAESIAAESFGFYRLANVSLRTGLDDFKNRLFFQKCLDDSLTIELNKFNPEDLTEPEELRKIVKINERKNCITGGTDISRYYFVWSLGQTKSYPKIIDSLVIPGTYLSTWKELLNSLHQDTHFRSNIFGKVEKPDFGYVVVEDIETVPFSDQQIRHWNKNIKKSWELFTKIKDSYLSQYSKPK